MRHAVAETGNLQLSVAEVTGTETKIDIVTDEISEVIFLEVFWRFIQTYVLHANKRSTRDLDAALNEWMNNISMTIVQGHKKDEAAEKVRVLRRINAKVLHLFFDEDKKSPEYQSAKAFITAMLKYHSVKAKVRE